MRMPACMRKRRIRWRRRSQRCRRAGSRAAAATRVTLGAATRMPAARRSGASSPTALATGSRGSRRPSVAERKAFQYTVLRVVPDVERGERVNVGVVLYSPERKFLGARTRVNEQRLRAIALDLDVAALRRHLDGLVAVAEGDPAGGPIAQLPQSERFGTLSAP